ncbi:extracellular solute-binding protein [Roseomonas terrae]|jgi:iron(III) transport system substrate-binding protein|uniref:Extracellular solute-binding protein n=1 Tax=Neoroseomonas terrae TaxID=424799 RepID=A0ABS5ECT9_9PROT|nr:extracellular solute-binding protein [Neoroseomonas terrae]MBR0648844.1 extracellular solute-binding protein [Neoroseomonas terrae]
MLRRSLLALAVIAAPAAAQAQGEVNLYNARHYDSDAAIYEAFTRETGIRVRIIQGDADQLMARIQSEGANSPADVFITVDATRLARAAQAGILQPYAMPEVDARVPEGRRDPNGMWFAITMRGRVIMYDKQAGRPEGLNRYEDLANERFRGQICVRASNHPYNVALATSILAADGVAETEAWARGVAANLARPPQGGDRDQFRAIPAGQCRLAISNTYYLGHVGASQRPEDRAVFERIGVIFPNQASGDRGTHVNVSGAALVKTSPNAANARRLLQFLVSDEAQAALAQGNMEYPSVPGAPVSPILRSLGEFRAEPITPLLDANRAAEALQIMQRAGWR